VHAVIVDDSAAPTQPPPWIGDPRISVSAEPTNAPDSAACVRQIRTHLADFVARAGTDISSLELKVVMTECELGSRAERYLLSGLSGAASCGITVNGQVNNRAIEMKTRRAQRVGAFGGDSVVLRDMALRRCLGDVEEKIIRVAELPDTPLGNRWRFMRWARWIAFAVVTLGVTGWLIGKGMRGIRDITGVMILGSLFALLTALLVFGSLALLTILSMPRTFFQDDRRGRRVMDFFGTRSMGMMRFSVIFFAVLLIAGLAGLIFGLTQL
jgi:hypothetical protein